MSVFVRTCIFLCFALSVSLLTACGDKNNIDDTDISSSSSDIQPPDTSIVTSSSSSVQFSNVSSSSIIPLSSSTQLSSSSIVFSSSSVALPGSSAVISSSSSSVLSVTCSNAESKNAFSKGTVFTPEMLGLQPGKNIGEINFNWYSGNDNSLRRTLVRIFNGECFVKETEGASASSVYNTTYRQHKATITGLEPNTQYTYWVSNDGTNWSNEYKYKTPPSGAFKFAAISDVQFNDEIAAVAGDAWKAIAKKIADEGVSLIVNAGDHVEHCNNGEDEYKEFFSPEELRNIPTAPVMGNHDLCPNFGNHFNLPNLVQGEGTYYAQANYYFLYNRILFIGLNTSPEATEANVAKYMADYEKTIDAAKAAHSKVQYDFIIVTHHKSTNSISAFGHALDEDVITYVNAGFQRMLTAKGVDLVFTGHDHVYVRSQLMKDDHPSADGTGTLYLTLKPASVTRNYSENLPTPGFYELTGFDPSLYISSYPFIKSYRSGYYTYYLPESYERHSAYDDSRPGYSIIEVNGARLTIKIYEETGTLFEQIELTPTLQK